MKEVDFNGLVVALVAPLVKHPEAVKVEEENTSHYHQFRVTVASTDTGRVIGRQGHVAAALRTIVEGARDKRVNDKKIRLIIHDHRH